MFIRYLKYLIIHKWFVFLECWKTGQFLHGITHDLSKFRPSEFFSYMYYFGSKRNFEKHGIAISFWTEENLELAWLHHQHRNKHHWNYWINSDGIAIEMPKKYISQMLADWRAMGRVFGDTAKEYYEKNKEKMKFHEDTIRDINDTFDIFSTVITTIIEPEA